MRTMGRVRTTVQCVQDGKIRANFHLKGLVVTDLYRWFNTDCVAGDLMRA